MLKYLGNGIIRSIGGLQAFLTTDANANMSSLNHAYVIGAITNGKRDGFAVFLHLYINVVRSVSKILSNTSI